MQLTRAYLPIRGSRIYYETTGQGEPILLLHGGLGTVQDFASQIPELSKQFKVVAFERPGHGHTADTNEPFGYRSMTDYTIGFIEELKLGPTNIVGWSDGGIITLLLAISRPDLVRCIVCVSNNFNTTYFTPKELEWLKAATAESFRKVVPWQAKRYDASSPDGPAHFATIVKKTTSMWMNEPNIRPEELAKISAPTLVMAADRDALPIEHSLELYRSIKRAQLCIVPGATHFLLSEKPQMINGIILDFLLKNKKANN